MTATVSIYDTYYDLDAFAGDSLDVMLVDSTYTFDATDSDVNSGDISAAEVVGSGYARITFVSFQRSGSTAGVLTDYELTSALFSPMTTSDYQAAVVFDDATGKPLFLIDNGSSAALSSEGLAITGAVFTIGA